MTAETASASSPRGAVATCQPSHTTQPPTQAIAAATDQVGKSRGGLRTAVATPGVAMAPNPANHSPNPTTATHFHPRTAPVLATSTPAIRRGSANRCSRSLQGRIGVRNMVGHNVNKVAVAVRPTNPSTLSTTWANISRPCHGSGWLNDISAPSTAPTGSSAAAAAYQWTTLSNRAGSARRCCHNNEMA